MYNSERCPEFRISNIKINGMKGRSNPFLNALSDLNLLSNKHIPKSYLINNTEVRKQVLAGLLDTDGYMTKSCYEIVTKFKSLAKFAYDQKKIDNLQEKIEKIENLNSVDNFFN